MSMECSTPIWEYRDMESGRVESTSSASPAKSPPVPGKTSSPCTPGSCEQNECLRTLGLVSAGLSPELRSLLIKPVC